MGKKEYRKEFWTVTLLGGIWGPQTGDRVFLVANTRHEPTEPFEPEAETDSRRRVARRIRIQMAQMAWGYYSRSPLVPLYFVPYNSLN